MESTNKVYFDDFVDKASIKLVRKSANRILRLNKETLLHISKIDGSAGTTDSIAGYASCIYTDCDCYTIKESCLSCIPYTC